MDCGSCASSGPVRGPIGACLARCRGRIIAAPASASDSESKRSRDPPTADAARLSALRWQRIDFAQTQNGISFREAPRHSSKAEERKKPPSNHRMLSSNDRQSRLLEPAWPIWPLRQRIEFGKGLAATHGCFSFRCA